MAQIRPFAAIRYARKRDLDISKVIAPPYDVLDEADKARLVAGHPQNIVNVDLPHLPPKTPGPDSAYDGANITLQSWLRAGILQRDTRAAFYPYSQTYDHGGRSHHRRGFFALVRLSPFGHGQVVPHEKTYQGAIEDRLKLMRATRAQLSPIFGLFSDPRNEVTDALYHSLGRPEQSATMGGVKNDLWSVTDAEIENRVIDLMGRKPIYIADGHHRYTTALTYQKEAEAANGGSLPPKHPANYCLFDLVSMQDPGLIVLPTHRIIGNVPGFDIAAFRVAVSGKFEVTETTLGADKLDEFVEHILPGQPAHGFGLYDGRTKKLYNLRLLDADVLKPLEPTHSDAWRRLDVAILQRYLLDEVLAKMTGGKELAKAYTPDATAVARMTDGQKHQVALLLRPTPVHALEELGKHNEVMPQKSTYFYPKLATGLVIAPLE